MALFKHQVEMIEFALKRDRSGNFGETGVGKSLATLEVIKERMKRGEVETVLVICPLTLIWNWQEEIEKWTDLTSVALKGNLTKRLDNLKKNADIYLINYEGVPLIKSALEEKNFDMIILDEAHKIKSRFASRSLAIFSVAEMTPYRMILTATPILNMPTDIYSEFFFLDPKILGENYYEFRDHYMKNLKETRKVPFNKWIVRKGKLKDLSDKIFKHAIRFRKADCLDLPDRVFVERKVGLSRDQETAYIDLAKRFKTELDGEMITIAGIFAKFLRLNQVCSGYLPAKTGIKHFSKNSKLELLKEVLEEIGEPQTIVWAYFHEDIERIVKEIKRADSIYGKTPVAQRQEVVKRFQEGKIQYLVAHPGCAGQGLNLTNAPYSIYYSRSFSLMERLQSLGRNYRIGSEVHSKITIFDLVSKLNANVVSIDEYILNSLKMKKKIADVVNRDSAFKLFDF